MYEHRIVKCAEKRAKIEKCVKRWEWTAGNLRGSSRAAFSISLPAII